MHKTISRYRVFVALIVFYVAFNLNIAALAEEIDQEDRTEEVSVDNEAAELQTEETPTSENENISETYDRPEESVISTFLESESQVEFNEADNHAESFEFSEKNEDEYREFDYQDRFAENIANCFSVYSDNGEVCGAFFGQRGIFLKLKRLEESMQDLVIGEFISNEESLKYDGYAYEIVELSPYKGDEEISETGPASITLYLDKILPYESVEMARVIHQKASGDFEELACALISNKKLAFETDNFSNFLILYKSATESDNENILKLFVDEEPEETEQPVAFLPGEVLEEPAEKEYRHSTKIETGRAELLAAKEVIKEPGKVVDSQSKLPGTGEMRSLYITAFIILLAALSITTIRRMLS